MKTKILLLEDDLNLSDTVCDYLEEKGFEVICVYDGEEALSSIYENSFDLLLLDVNVPIKNGFQVLKEIRKDGNNTPAIYIFFKVDSLE
jgi:DNA-binding response OmpR family regulator